MPEFGQIWLWGARYVGRDGSALRRDITLARVITSDFIANTDELNISPDPKGVAAYRRRADSALRSCIQTVATLETPNHKPHFHEAGLDCGRVPLDILDGVIDRYIKTKVA